jgi:hypothetical protein
MNQDKLDALIITALKFEASDHGGKEHGDLCYEAIEQYIVGMMARDNQPENAAEIRLEAECVARDRNDIQVNDDAFVEDNGESGWWIECSVFIPYFDEDED